MKNENIAYTLNHMKLQLYIRKDLRWQSKSCLDGID
jgi:hypothetical protein